MIRLWTFGNEVLPVREYADILDAGFEGGKSRRDPAGNDKVTIGDIRRTRLNHIKILFLSVSMTMLCRKRAMPEDHLAV